MSRAIRYINLVNDWSGRIFSYAAIVMVVAISYEVIARYVFDSPTMWAHEITTYAFMLLILMGGGYTFLKGGHVSMDAVYVRLSPRARAILDLVARLLAMLFLVVFIWQTVDYALYSTAKLEKSLVLLFPIYIIKWFLPVGGFLFFLQVLSRFAQTISALLGKAGGTSPGGNQ